MFCHGQKDTWVMKCPNCKYENPSDTRFCGNCAAHLYPSEDIQTNQIKKGIKLANELEEYVWTSKFHLQLAYVYLKSGNPIEALKECNKVESQVRALHLKGLIYLDMDLINDAQKTANDLKAIIQGGIKEKEIRYYSYLMGMIELEKGNFSKATEYLENALALLPAQKYFGGNQALFINSLAQVYYKTKELKRAQEEYQKIISLSGGRLYYGDLYSKSHYMLGKIFEDRGLAEKAIENHEKFLSLWKNSENDLPEIIDVKKRLNTLQNIN